MEIPNVSEAEEGDERHYEPVQQLCPSAKIKQWHSPRNVLKFQNACVRASDSRGGTDVSPVGPSET